jgi:S-adenosylmethionine:tRNA ribosyltransferase-isomerase
VTALAPALTRFRLPPGSEAGGPPERRGIGRDGVRLLVAAPGRSACGRSVSIRHRRFHDLPELLTPGDLVVVNTSATLPAALDVVRGDGRRHVLHVSTWLDDGDWVVEVRQPGGPAVDVRPGERLGLPGEVVLRVRSSYPVEGVDGSRLWRATPTPAVPLLGYLPRHGRAIRYAYLAGAWPLSDFQTVYATQPGSAEMPSAGRPFTERVLVRLMAAGIPVVPVVLHAGVSSQEAHEPPLPERLTVPEVTARLVNATLAAGRRVVAVGTTVVRALESAAGDDGLVRPASGWTDLVVRPGHPVRVVGGLVTGLHPPEASHLLLLEAVAGAELVGAAYEAAVASGYRWHEFGDVTLFLP